MSHDNRLLLDKNLMIKVWLDEESKIIFKNVIIIIMVIIITIIT